MRGRYNFLVVCNAMSVAMPAGGRKMNRRQLTNSMPAPLTECRAGNVKIPQIFVAI